MTSPATTPVIAIDDCGVALPAWALRLAVALMAAAVVAVLALDGLPPATLMVLALLAAATVLSPASAAPAALAATAALATLLNSGGALRPTVLALVPLVHLLHVTSAVAAVVPRGARVHLPVLRRTAARFLTVQASVFALAGVAALLPHGPTPVHLEVVTVLGVAALAVAAIVLLRRR